MFLLFCFIFSLSWEGIGGGRVPREKERTLRLAFKLLFSPSFASFRNKLRLSPISLYFLFPFASHPRSFFLFLSAFLASVFSGFSNPLFRVVEGRRRSCPSPPRSTAVKQTRKPRNRSPKASTARRHRRRRNEGERARWRPENQGLRVVTPELRAVSLERLIKS